jgi:solute carrier family 25 citrate transporter 1
VLWGKHEGDGKRLEAWQSTISGFMAACLGPTATNPFDVVKTRMMAQAKAPPDAPRYR